MKRGILDIIDELLGRLSDSDTISGKRKRSWGITAMFWMSCPLVLLILSAGTAQIIFAVSYVPRVPKGLLRAYEKCLQKAQKLKSLKACKLPKIASGKASRLEFGKWPWIGAICMFAAGVFFAVIRRKQDFERFKETAQVLSLFSKNGQSIPPAVLDAFKVTTHKLSGEELMMPNTLSKGH